MTILFLGGDLSSMKSTGFAGELTSRNFYGPIPFTELGVRSSGDASVEYVGTTEWSAQSEVWVHAIVAGHDPLIHIMNGTTVIGRIRVAGSAYRFEYLSGASTFTQVGTDFTLPGTNVWNYIDVYFKTGASGAAAVYVNGVERMPQASASITYSTDITSVRFPGGINDFGGVAVATEPTIGWRLARLQPSGGGANSAWTGDYTSVDETTLNEADYIYSSTANQVETFSVTPTPSSFTGYVPRAVAVSARARRGSSGPQKMQLTLRSGGTDYFSGDQTLGLGFQGFEHVWETNPDTSADWTTAQLTGLQIGVKSIA